MHWPKFIKHFYHRIHKKWSLNDSLRMDHLTNSLDGEAKKSLKTVGTKGYFYVTTLKVLKEISATFSSVAFHIEKSI